MSEQKSLVVVSPGRPAYPVRAKESFGVDLAGWRALVDAVWPSAKTTEAVVLALSYCKARNLDPFKRPVHIVPVWDSKLRKEVETIWPGIGELRTTAARTGEYAGFDEAVFGPEQTVTFKGVVREKAVEKTVTFPTWCQITVYRIVKGQRVPFPGPKVRWLETYATMGGSDVPNEMWATRSYGQLEKCAEAATLRRAFPEEVGSEYIADEVDKRGAPINVTPEPEPTGTTRSEQLLGKLAAAPEAAEIDLSASPEPELVEVVPEEEDALVRALKASLAAAAAAPTSPPEPPKGAPEPDTKAMLDKVGALLTGHLGDDTERRKDALEAAFGTRDRRVVARLPPAEMAVGLAALERHLGGLAAMAAGAPPEASPEREPGTGGDDEA